MTLRLITILSMLLISQASASADQFNINVSSGESAMLFVVIYDMNTRAQNKVFDATITSGQFIPVYITGDSGNDGHITWTTQTADRQKCGSGEESNLSSGSNITVRAPSSC